MYGELSVLDGRLAARVGPVRLSLIATAALLLHDPRTNLALHWCGVSMHDY
jgi:hypothetical protein